MIIQDIFIPEPPTRRHDRVCEPVGGTGSTLQSLRLGERRPRRRIRAATVGKNEACQEDA